MSVKTAGVGHFQIPTAPAAGTSVTSGAANTYTTNAVQLIASTAAALYITGIYAEEAAVSAPSYKSVQLMIGAGGAETNLGQYLIAPSTGSTVTRAYRPIFPPIPVASGQRISVKTADSAGSLATLISLECIAQSNVVDDGIAITTVSTVTTVTNQLTAAQIATGVWQDATAGDFSTASSIGKSLYIANVAPGGSGGLMISGTNAGTTTLGALTITGATTHTGATVHTGNVSLADGLTIAAPSTGNRAGFSVAGNGTGAAILATGGATGVGFSIIGGATSGDGVKVTTTSGHGVNLAPVGTNMHGLLSTGGNGGTSDGIKAAAGTGGVDFRANQTGNLTGTVATLTTYTGNTPQTGDAFARLGAPAGASVSADVAAVKVDTAAVKTKTDFLPSATAGATGGVFIAGTNAATTITTGLTTTFTGNLTGSVASVTGAVGSVTGAVGSVTGAVGSVTGAVGSVTGAVGSVTGLTASDVGAIKTKTDSLTFTVAAKLDVNVLVVNGSVVTGSGTTGVPWGPA